MNDKRVTEHSRVIVFDMPWHGKSSPPIGWQRDKFIGYLLPVLENIRGP
jgi:hypothetical protein